ncbi:MAG: amino acid adenylation domain-containing protein [Butyrivibrio sp.]|uniref:amino acid adenylation domain-containing protein n=1 Tax=Butyrivibrio sp. TaxID=28121 RepID=UPI0025C04DCE|nr:amino acid adenylation domain-containing protein [Butyrivibrio sp.]MBQ6587180.1 amino acid adenylation domain-containing protein [Butyrivibrio sp.]
MMNSKYIYNLGMYFEAITEECSNECAIIWDTDEKITFLELNTISNKIANLFLLKGIKKNDVVAIQNNKTKYGFGCMLACLKIGATYTNFDYTNPLERIRKIFDTACPVIVVADESNDMIYGLCEEKNIEYFVIPDADKEIEKQESKVSTEIITSVTKSDPAYIMFTSGSTGIPKGVLISQGSLIDFISWGMKTYNLRSNDILTNVNPIYFDNSVFDFYCSVFNGISMLAVPKSMVEKPKDMLELIDRVGCTLWFSVPSMLIYLTNLKLLSENVLQSVRIFAFGGEGYPKELLRKLYRIYGTKSEFYNVYGPTEGTCICSAYHISDEDIEAEGLAPLGKIAPNFKYVILDENDNESQIGELCIMGTQLALGYYNDEERTNKSFVRNPLQKNYYERMYRTGDLVELVSDNLYFRGRVDNQIKHMGYRIELEEIESSLIKLEGVKQCAVIHTLSKNQFSKLVAYVATNEGLTEENIKRHLKDYLPQYMIPNQVIIVDELPKNANGKVDRQILKMSI